MIYNTDTAPSVRNVPFLIVVILLMLCIISIPSLCVSTRIIPVKKVLSCSKSEMVKISKIQGCDRGFRSARTRFGAYFRPSYLLGRAGKSIHIQKHTKSIQKAYKSVQKHTKAYKSVSTNQLGQIRADPALSQPCKNLKIS